MWICNINYKWVCLYLMVLLIRISMLLKYISYRILFLENWGFWYKLLMIIMIMWFLKNYV